MENSEVYRYPGTRPFEDTILDRKLFKGRDDEIQVLLHLILSETLVVLYASSGVGKTSLLQAGIFQLLRENAHFPVVVRFNNPKKTPLQLVYDGVPDAANKSMVECKPGNNETLWEYFKTTEIWMQDTLFTPVLILDQFEEFFRDDISEEERTNFIMQLASFIRERMPASFSKKPPEELTFWEVPPSLKIIISIREDYLGSLEEMSSEIPTILDKRFRLVPLKREQARKAIEEPARLEDVPTTRFLYKEDAREMIIDFCSKKAGGKVINKVEPFLVQLICSHVEKDIPKGDASGAIPLITKNVIGGEKGLEGVIEKHYITILNDLNRRDRKRVVRVCENALISPNKRRLSLAEGTLIIEHKIPKKIIEILHEKRLLRKELRGEIVYYELSHDKFIQPIIECQKQKKAKMVAAIAGVSVVCVLLTVVYYYVNTKNLETELTTTNSKLYYEKGTYNYKLKEYESAINNYTEAIKLDPRNADAYNGIGDASYSLERYDEAIENYKKARDINPKIEIGFQYAAAYKCRGDELYYHQKYDEAIENYKKATEIDPKIEIGFEYADAYYRIGDAMYNSKKYEEAIENYRKVIKIDPKHTNAYYSMGASLRNLDRYEEALENYKKAIVINPTLAYVYNGIGVVLHELGEYYKAIENYRKALEIEPKDATVYRNIGGAFYSLKKYDEAIENYKKALEIDPKLASAYNGLGNVLYSSMKYDEAVENYEKAIEFGLKDATFYSNIGGAFYSLKKYQEAIENYKKSLAIDPTRASTYVSIGNVLDRSGKYEEAIENYRKALEIDPENANAYNYHGLVLSNLKMYDEAIENFKKALALDPESEVYCTNIGNVFFSQRNYEKAYEYYQKALGLNPEYSRAYSGLGNVSTSRGNINEAIDNYKKALVYNATNSSAINGFANVLEMLRRDNEAIEKYVKANNGENVWGNFGGVFFVKKDYVQSIETSRKGLDIDPNRVWIRSNLAIALLHNGNYEEAKKEYKKVISLIKNGQDTDGGKDKRKLLQEECLDKLNEARKDAKGQLLEEIKEVITLLKEAEKEL